jgi:hypothetical protein
MPFTKGKSGNPHGKPKGAVGKATQERRDFIKNLLDDEKENIKDALKRTHQRYPHIYLGIINDLMEFDTPKLSRIEMKAEGEIDFGVTINKIVTKDVTGND